MSTLPVTERTKLRRLPARGSYDQDTVYAILDTALVCHLGVVRDGAPLVTPTACWRVGDHVYFHGAPSSRTLKGSTGPMCLTVTHLDGLVLARSAFHHSINYRSVIVFGEAEEVPEAEKMAALEAFVEHVSRGRWAAVRAPSEAELRGTRVMRLPLSEASAKIRVGGPVDDEPDYALNVWAGVVPMAVVKGEAQGDGRLREGIPQPQGLVEGCWPRS